MDDEWERAVQKLIQMTERGDVRWSAMDTSRSPDVSTDPDDVLGSVFESRVAGRRILVYAKLSRSELIAGSSLRKSSSIIIEFAEGGWIWPVPMPLRFELLEAIRDQVANPDQFLEHFLADQPTT